MSTPLPSDAQRRLDRQRLRRALNASLGFVLLLAACFSAQHAFDWTFLTVTPWSAAGLLGLLAAPLLHGSVEHIVANAIALLMLGTLAGTAFPKATLRALPLLWLGSGLGAWLLGQPGSHHLGASGLTHGLMFLVFVLGLLRRDRAAIAAGMLAFMFYGGMLMTVLPREPGVSWQAHLGGALAGAGGGGALGGGERDHDQRGTPHTSSSSAGSSITKRAPPPGRSSTTNGWPRDFCRRSPRKRA